MTTNPDLKSRTTRRPGTRQMEIMEAAINIFSSKGFRATTLDEVAATAGVTKGAIYHYFTGKEDLLLRSMDMWLNAHMLPQKDLMSAESGTGSARLSLLIRHVWENWRSTKVPGILRLVYGELVTEFPEIMERWYEESVIPMLQIIDEVIEQGKASGEFRKDLDTAATVYVLIGISEIATRQFHVPIQSQQLLPPDRVIDSLIDVFFRGVQQKPRRVRRN